MIKKTTFVKKNKKLYSWGIFITLAFLFIQCNGTKTLQVEQPKFSIKEAYYNKLVAGEKSIPTYIELSIIMEKTGEELQFDSILFKGSVKKTQVVKSEQQTFLSIRLKEANAKKSTYKSIEITDKQAVIFYSQNKKSYFYHVKIIEERETVFQP